MKIKVASLFAGVGGICLGFQSAKFENKSYELIWANEIDEYACKTYETNFEHSLIRGDIEKIVNPSREENSALRNDYIKKRDFILSQDIDLLNGGFPCQAFSIAGNRKGFDDHRGNLFWSIVDLIKLLEAKNKKPKALFLENVKNLMSHDNGNTYKVIKNELQNLGYHIKEAILNTKDFSALPQNRERIYIVGFLDETASKKFTMFDNQNLIKYKYNFSDEERKSSIKNLIDFNINNIENPEYYYTPQKYPRYFIDKNTYEMLQDEDKNSVRINLSEDISDFFEFYQLRRGMYVRKNQSGVCPTLTANMGTGGHNVPLIRVKDGIRKLTPKETFKLQGFPIGEKYKLPNISDARLYKQSGNAVSVDVITLIANEILKII